jgi:exodeoxyribonuclease VII small subunit
MRNEHLRQEIWHAIGTIDQAADYRKRGKVIDSHADSSLDDAVSFEASLAALEAAVHDLEDGQLALSDALARYEASVKHLKNCYQLLEAAEQKIELLAGVTDDGTPQTSAFVAAEQEANGRVGRKRRARPKPASAAGEAAVDDIEVLASDT